MTRRVERFQKKEFDHDYNIEDESKKARSGEMAAIDYEKKMERLKREENIDDLNRLVEQGDITREEAQKIIARKKMHDKTAEEGPELKGVVAAAADFQTTEQMLEDVLDYESKNPFVRCIENALGISRLRKAVRNENQRRKSKDFKHPFPYVNAFVKVKVFGAEVFELFIGAVMLFNAITIGVQASRSTEDTDEAERGGEMDTIALAENIMTGIFILEIFLRFMSDGWVWIMSVQNVLDTGLIVITGVLPLWILAPANIEVDEMRALQVLRVVRLTRIVRLVRTVKAFRIFWNLIQGIMDSGKVLFWMYVLMGAVLYTFSLFCVYWLGKDPDLVDDESTQVHFGDVPKAMISLFQILTLDSWSSVARPMMDQVRPSAKYRVVLLFIMTIMICSMVLLNLIMAIIVNNAFKRAAEDEELNVKIKQEEVESEIDELERIFRVIDADESGFVSKEEYTNAVRNNSEVQMKFKVMDIGEKEAEEIWDLLDAGDTQGGGEVSIEQFTNTLRCLQGDAKAKDSFTIVKRVNQVNILIAKLHAHMDQCRAEADKVRAECMAAHRALGGALQEMMEFVYYAGLCVPAKAAPRPTKALDEDLQKRQMVVEEVESMDMSSPRSGERSPNGRSPLARSPVSRPITRS